MHNILMSTAGPVIHHTLADGLGGVAAIFARGPETPLSYEAEFSREISRLREEKIKAVHELRSATPGDLQR